VSDKRPDGRRERTFRTRKLLIEAYINVAGEKKRIPKTGEVALRAGVSQRSDINRARPDAGGPVDHEALLQRNASATACTISSLP
jgi:hypothetical protein